MQQQLKFRFKPEPGSVLVMHADWVDDAGAGLVVRAASAEDYPTFARLFPELFVADPLPSAEVWASTLCPTSWIATRGAEAVGFYYFQEYFEAGYVRNIVVAPSARRSGVGQALMRATAEHLRSRGKRSWRLNVMPDNPAALALYARMGMHVKYVTQSLGLQGAGASVRDEILHMAGSLEHVHF